ncbi:hypothetical protein AMTR_s00099p00156210 [Amborella trichopoda]|uniref:Uncharacterized protein n=1 Tax=Amborella trichopoda TaxID=13333 RepID=W1NW12_AMBTC|nr:hypothetical protein AMTR_s00099p00156210 [Amborella trichopoda]
MGGRRSRQIASIPREEAQESTVDEPQMTYRGVGAATGWGHTAWMAWKRRHDKVECICCTRGETNGARRQTGVEFRRWWGAACQPREGEDGKRWHVSGSGVCRGVDK